MQRNAFDLETIRKVARVAKEANPSIIVFVDNCYGEFTQTQEPCQVGGGPDRGQPDQKPRRRDRPHRRLHRRPAGSGGAVRPTA